MVIVSVRSPFCEEPEPQPSASHSAAQAPQRAGIPFLVSPHFGSSPGNLLALAPNDSEVECAAGQEDLEITVERERA
eukprot:m.509407 g.509407  ORF g.509407 m.509407 type:complete len:77 (+) comp57402_c0_seq3:28-258(+)